MKKELTDMSFSFKLEDGNFLHISQKDIEVIKQKLLSELILGDNTKIFITQNTAMERYQMLEKTLKESQDHMSDETKSKYFDAMLQLLVENANEAIPMSEMIGKQK